MLRGRFTRRMEDYKTFKVNNMIKETYIVNYVDTIVGQSYHSFRKVHKCLVPGGNPNADPRVCYFVETPDGRIDRITEEKFTELLVNPVP